jgi:hypothetical protein
MSEYLYQGYPLVGVETPVEEAEILQRRAAEIRVSDSGVPGLDHRVEGIEYTHVIVRRIIDPQKEIDGFFLVKVLDGVPKLIIVSPENIYKKEGGL